MSIKIGHASIADNGKVSGGIPGDQTKAEVCIRKWYNKPWSVMLRPVNEEIAEKSAKACEAGCANDFIGYSQAKRNTLHTQAIIANYDLSKISVPCETDCSAFMTVCAIAGGVKELEYTGNAPTTSTMVDIFTKTGKYKSYTDSKYLTSDKYLKRGDILVKPGSHAVMVIENGTNISEKNTNISSLSYPCKGIDVAAWQTGLDYNKLKQGGVQFAILKIIRKDGNPDGQFENHYKGFTQAGIPVVGVYNYVYSVNVESAKITAQKVIRILNGRKLPVCMDVEDKCLQGLGERLIDIINGYQEVVKGAGLPFVLYTGMSFWNSYIKPYQAKLRSKNNWIARYYNGYNEMNISQTPNNKYKPTMPNLAGWQYTSSLAISGSPGRLDGDILYSSLQNRVADKQQRGIVKANTLRVREQPNTNCATLGYLKRGEMVYITSTDPQTGWYNIGSGWVSNVYIDLV